MAANTGNGALEGGDFRTVPADAWENVYASFAPEVSPATTEDSTIENDRDLGVTDTSAAQVLTEPAPSPESDTEQPAPSPESDSSASMSVPDDTTVTPQGPQIGSGKCLGFLAAETPGNACSDEECGQSADEMEPAKIYSDNARAAPLTFAELQEAYGDDDIPFLELAEIETSENLSPNAAGSQGNKAWKKISAASAQVADAVRHRTPQLPGLPNAQTAKDQVQKVQKSIEYMKDSTQGGAKKALLIPAQMSGTMRRMPAQVSDTAQKGFGYAKERAESAREKAQSVTAAVTAKVSQTAHKGLGMAMGRAKAQPQAQAGGA